MPAPGVLPATRPSRVVVEPVAPLVDGGAFPTKATVGEPVEVLADVFADGHDQANAAVRFRPVGGTWSEVPMVAIGNDRYRATFTPDAIGRWEYRIVGWLDHFGSWRHAMERRMAAEVDLDVDLQIGIGLVRAASAAAGRSSPDAAALTDLAARLQAGDTDLLVHEPSPDWRPPPPDELDRLFWRTAPRRPTALSRPFALDVDPVLARASAWYEFFPRSTVGEATGPATLRDAVGRLDHIADLGFDVVYLPPIHPIGTTFRKGRNNAVTATSDDTGSPWAIGAPEGGHTAVHPELGTVEDLAALAGECRQRGMELAMDIAFQCTPDHPWVAEHPAWFAHRPDGSIQYAENPPKKYQDIYPIDFETEDWRALWDELAGVVRFWIDQGATIFRVDNPHTKAFAFWEWAIASIRADHPEAIFLAEAFTRPRVMERLAKIGFNQSYTYFTWRQASWELQEYFEDLSTRTVDYFRPNAWPNTPDILTEQLQTGGRAMFAARAVLAATLSPSWGVYGPAFELLEHMPASPGSEEYLDSEKYQVRHWDLGRPDSLAPLLRVLNHLRRDLPALTHLRTLRFHRVEDNPALLCYSKSDPTGSSPPVLVVVNLDAHRAQDGTIDVDLAALGLPYDVTYDVVDHLNGGARSRWHGAHTRIHLDPAITPALVLTVEGLS